MCARMTIYGLYIILYKSAEKNSHGQGYVYHIMNALFNRNVHHFLQIWKLCLISNYIIIRNAHACNLYNNFICNSIVQGNVRMYKAHAYAVHNVRVAHQIAIIVMHTLNFYN